MGQSKQLTLSRLSATGTIVTVRPKMTSCLLGWLSPPPSTKKSSPLPSPRAPSSQAPSACFQVWTGAKTTMVSAPATEHQVVSYTWWDKLGRGPCPYNRGQRRVGWRPRGGTPRGVWQRDPPRSPESSFHRVPKAPLRLQSFGRWSHQATWSAQRPRLRLSEARFTLKRLLFPILAHFSCGGHLTRGDKVTSYSSKNGHRVERKRCFLKRHKGHFKFLKINPHNHAQNHIFFLPHYFVQFSSVTQSCLTLCNPMDCSSPGFPVHLPLPEFTQTHVHWVGDAIQPSHPLLSPSPPAFNLSQHQGLFKWVSSSHQVVQVLFRQIQNISWNRDWGLES